jgi:DNA-binding transcriptional MerR regulator
VGLLKPKRNLKNDYRYYENDELLKLQQILFFKELDFPLVEIKKILSSPTFDMKAILRDQRKLIEIKKNRLAKLIKTIDKTINSINKKTIMNDDEIYENFSKEEIKKFSEEAKQRWSNTEAYKQSQERVKKMGKDGLKKILEESSKLTLQIVDCMKDGQSPKNPEVQKLFARKYEDLRAFYEPSLEIYEGLAKMYVEDPRFKKTYENIAIGLAVYMRDGILEYVKNNK